MKVVFMGTPDFSVPVLQALIRKHDVICVYTQPPRPAGRGHKLTPSPVQVEAEKHKIPVRYPVSLKNETEQHIFAALDADVAVVCAYGLILPIPVLRAFKGGCINVHASLLPRWRGAAPIQRAIMAGDKETGVTIMQMDAGLDTGPMLLQESFPLTGKETTTSLTETVAKLGAEMLVRLLAAPEKITITPQPSEGVTYAHKVTKEEGHLNFDLSFEEVERKIRAFSPFPSSFAEHNGTIIKIWQAQPCPDMSGKPGEVLQIDKEGVVIACARGAIRATVLQRPGKPKMSAQSFLQGYNIVVGEYLK